jgi:hypothetical protein
MATLNDVLRLAFDLALAPFRGWPPIVSLALASLAVSVLMLVVFKRTSNQTALAAVKRRIHAGLFEIRLFNDDLRAILHAQATILRANARYLALSLVPMLFILPPLVLVMAQLQFHYGYLGLRPGQETVLEVDLAPQTATGSRPTVTLDLPPGLRATLGPAWLPAQSRLAWRLVAEHEGDYELALTVDGSARVTKTARATSHLVRLSPARVGSGFVDQLLYPAEPPLPAGHVVRAIRIGYADRAVDVLGFGLHWMIPFFALSIVFAFALKGLFKVTI